MSTRHMTLTAMLTALLCIVGPLTLPIGPVPLSLTTAVLMLMALLLGGGRATMCCAVYLLIGSVGLPVFSGFRGGLAVLLGPTGGFLLGYPVLTALCGWICTRTQRRCLHLLGMLAGTALLYLLGTAWFCVQTGNSVQTAMLLCVLPCLPGDAGKIAAVLIGGNAVKARLARSGMLR